MSIRSMIESVARGADPRSILLEAEGIPSWKTGDPVPDGFKVVFGRLAKASRVDKWKSSHRYEPPTTGVSGQRLSSQGDQAEQSGHLGMAAGHHRAAATAFAASGQMTAAKRADTKFRQLTKRYFDGEGHD